jgi:hypothetical protein
MIENYIFFFIIIIIIIIIIYNSITIVDCFGNTMSPNDFHKFGLKANTDKIYTHGYHRFYHKELDKYRNLKNTGIVEIGVQGSESINLWLDYFPNSHIYGLDIDKKEFNNPNVDLFVCDQSKLSDLQLVSSKFNPNYPIVFIIDDGSHIPEHQILTFDFLFNNVLQDGGIYIIEDIELSYWKNGNLYGYQAKYGWKNKNSLIEKFKLLIDYINNKYLSDNNKNELNIETNFISNETKNKISSIIFGQNCIIIYKKTKEEYDPSNEYNKSNYRFKQNV